MKILDIELSEVITEELKTWIECIARFENLKEFTLNIRIMKISPTVPITDRFFDIFPVFKGIENLRIKISPEIEMKGSIESFKHCKQFKHSDINYDKLREDFFANIASFVPKLGMHHFTKVRFTKNL